MTDWFAHKDIILTKDGFCPVEQIVWLLSKYHELATGRWPHKDEEESSVDERLRHVDQDNRVRAWKPTAYFEQPCRIAAEIDMRLMRLNRTERMVIKATCIDGLDLYKASRRLGLAEHLVVLWRHRGLVRMSLPIRKLDRYKEGA